MNERNMQMARREITQFFDDLDNTPLNEDEVNVVDFSVNGIDYTLDLSAKNSKAFDEPWLPLLRLLAARPVVAPPVVAPHNVIPTRSVTV